jgi:hypothetical protein
MEQLPKQGSKWQGNNNVIFRVINIVEVDDHTWVHYRKENTTSEPQEYSCYVESFLSKFTEIL